MRAPREDLTGQKNGLMTMLGWSDENYRGKRLWVAQCECGNVSDKIRAEHWNRGVHTSCGCVGAPPVKQGERYGAWTVIQDRNNMTKRVTARCDCGAERTIAPSDLRLNKSRQCERCSYDEKIKPDNYAAKRSVHSYYKANARARGLDFDIDFDTFIDIAAENCNYCGVKDSNIKTLSSGSHYKYNGLDRLDSGFGYTKDNIVACCTICNFAKGKYSALEFEAWLDQIANYRRGKNNGEAKTI